MTYKPHHTIGLVSEKKDKKEIIEICKELRQKDVKCHYCAIFVLHLCFRIYRLCLCEFIVLFYVLIALLNEIFEEEGIHGE